MADITLAALGGLMEGVEEQAAQKLSQVIDNIDAKKGEAVTLQDMLKMQRAWGEYSLVGEVATSTLKQHVDVMAEAARKS
ncbi:MAG: hypothetical protein ACRYG5_15835 [Janthinobacterium lividum]